MSVRKRDPEWVDVMQAADESGRRIRAVIRRRQARVMLSAVFGVVIALTVTALLALPHLTQEPVEVAAEITEASALTAEETPQPTPISTSFSQHTDPLLILVNEKTPLPQDFSLQPRSFDGVEVNALMYTDLCAMMDAAAADDCVLWLASGYRSVETQESVLEKAVENRMRDGMTRETAYADARQTIQKPGYSEHHTGLAIDLNNVSYDFETSKEYGWLRTHAAQYGFVERYPRGKETDTGIDFEPWHYRYVGKTHAQRMNTLGMCLEEYVSYCFENGIS